MASSSSTDYGSLLDVARQAFTDGKTKPLEWRKTQLKQFIKMFQENSQDFYDALKKDLSKPKQESFSFEVDYNINAFKGALFEVEKWIQDEYVEKNMLTLMDTTYIHRDPYGVVLVMGAWNYPVQLTLAPVAGAIAAGNSVFIKPSELSPNSADLMKRLIHKYCDPECIRVICGGIPETTALLKHKFDYIFFTGSMTVGRIIGEAANKHLTPCTLELGGKCPVWIDETVNLKIAVKRLIWAKMINLGQTCVAPDYIICTPEVQDQFLRMAKEVYAEFYGQNAQDSPDLCRIVNERNFDRLAAVLNGTNGTVSFGGNKDKSDLWMDLTIVTDIKDPANDSVMKDELFGPILPICTVSNVQEAIKLINSKEKPLSLYIFSQNERLRKNIIAKTSSGSVCCNDAIVQLSVETLPFGGVGSSGYGAYHGKYTYETFSHSKSVLERDFGFVGENLGKFRYPPYSESKISWLSLLLKKRNFPIPDNFGSLLGKVFWLSLGAASMVGYKMAARKYGLEVPSCLQ